MAAPLRAGKLVLSARMTALRTRADVAGKHRHGPRFALLADISLLANETTWADHSGRCFTNSVV